MTLLKNFLLLKGDLFYLLTVILYSSLGLKIKTSTLSFRHNTRKVEFSNGTPVQFKNPVILWLIKTSFYSQSWIHNEIYCQNLEVALYLYVK